MKSGTRKLARAMQESQADPSDEPPLLPRGNPHRPRALFIALAGGAVPFLIMCTDRHFAWSVPAGALGCLVAAFGLLDFFGTFDDAQEGDATPIRTLAPLVAELLGSAAVFVLAVRLAVAGRLPFQTLSAALLITGALFWLVIAGFRLFARLGVTDPARPLFARSGFWLVALNLLLYLPLLGSYSLSDPWEAHYGEVAREMLARDDWISTWWAQEGFFWSKPVLDMWLQALAFSLFGVRFEPDGMIAAAGAGLYPAPEWAARLPVTLLAVFASYVVYRAVRARFDERAGLIGGVVLTALPYWYFLSHQSMTDMPYVAPLTIALGFALVGLGSDPEARVRTVGLEVSGRKLGLSAYHLLFGFVLLTALPQLFYLLSRHLTLRLSEAPYGFRWHLDEFEAGSAGNCGLPGNEACRAIDPVDATFQPAVGALVWGAALVMLLWANRGERRVQRLAFLAAWAFTALSALAKGAPGLVLPLVTVLVVLGAARRYRDLPRLELVGLGLLLACVCLPWYAQMYARHGPPFTDRLLFHDMYKRAFVHVHDTNAGDNLSFRYYVWQLGYGLFPFTGLAATSLFFWQRDGDEAENPKAEAMGLFVLWFLLSFAMFSVSLTKFHHYVLPCVPPLAVLTGVLLDRALPVVSATPRQLAGYVAAMGAGSLFLLYGAARLLGGSPLGTVPAPAPSLAIGVPSLMLGALAVGFAVRRSPFSKPAADEPRGAALVALSGVGAAVGVWLVGRDLYSPDDPQGAARLTHLFSYNYKRPWPDSLDFSGVLAAITLTVAVACLAFVLPRARAHAAVGVLCLGTWAALWGVDAYLLETAPHWGQRETLLEYYRRRKGPEEMLIAFQMNWKGENFYTGNRIPAFVSSGATFRNFMKEQREAGTRVLFFTTEHSRESGLKTELGQVQSFEKLTTKELNNKFFLARVEL